MEKNDLQPLQVGVNHPPLILIDYAKKIKACYQAIEKNCFDIKSLTTLNEIYKALDEAKIIQLNSNDSIEVVLNKFVTKFLYISYRHSEESKSYQEIRSCITILKPELKNSSVEDLKNFVRKQEENSNNYFGCYLSDDSDSEDYMDESDEDIYSINTTMLPAQRYEQFKDFLAKNMVKILMLDRDLKLKDFTCLSSFDERQSLNYKGDSFEKAKLELELLNKQLKEGKSINQIQAKLKTRFFVAQYRGVTYFLDKWNQTTRKNHREIDETFECYYSEAVYHAAGYVPMNQFFKTKEQPVKEQQKLYSKAVILKGKMISLQTTKAPASYKNKTYNNFKLLLQETYTNNYTEFKNLITNNKLLKKILVNEGNPFVSTADTPYHALRYAYGMKAYPRQKEFRLQPRWNKEGKAERPYIGKCYAFLIPINDFNLLENPSHLVSQNWQGELSVPNHIVAERETSFDAFIDKDKIFLQHMAKFPSFNMPFHKSFILKYGLDEPLYLLLQTAMKQTKPHTQARKNLKLLIGEWLCYFHEIRLIKEAQAAATNHGGFLVYHDNEKNQFSFEIPIDTPMRNNKEVTPEERQAVKNKRRQNISNIFYSRPFYSYNNNNTEEVAHDRSGMSEIIEELSIESDIPSSYPQMNSSIESSQPNISNTNQITISNVDEQRAQSVTQQNLIQTIIANHSSNNNISDNNVNSVNQPIIIEDSDSYEFSLQRCYEEAMKGNPIAQYELGLRYEYGHEVTKDQKKSVEFYFKAIEQKYSPAIEHIQKKATDGCAWAEYFYGWLHEYGYGVPQNAMKAFYWIKRAADQKFPQALYALALCYDVGNRVNKNELEAVNLCQQAAEQDYALALEWLEQKAVQNAEAQYALGSLYINGVGVPENKEKAFNYIQKAAKQHHLNAQYQLALCYESGYGVAKNENLAVKYCRILAEKRFAPAIEWLHKKSEQDKNVLAQYWLGWLYSLGRGVPYDVNKAFELLESAAKQNYVNAQHTVAQCYQHGRGVEKNLQLATEWYIKAAANGDENAKAELEKMSQAPTNLFNFNP